jgi:hypothetical protein
MVPLLIVTMCLAACRRPAHVGYVPELGELMILQQARHTKLWLAGEAGNWPLAAYELDELDEGFDAIVSYHPTYDHDGAPVAPKDAIPRMIRTPLADLRDAVKRQDGASFAARYGELTTACNNCHQAMNVGFNRVQVPEANPYPNQVFAVPQPEN